MQDKIHWVILRKISTTEMKINPNQSTKVCKASSWGVSHAPESVQFSPQDLSGQELLDLASVLVGEEPTHSIDSKGN